MEKGTAEGFELTELEEGHCPKEIGVTLAEQCYPRPLSAWEVSLIECEAEDGDAEKGVPLLMLNEERFYRHCGGPLWDCD